MHLQNNSSLPTLDPSVLVSVILPFLNGGGWLKEAIDSVIVQSYSNWELILMDDGSTSETTSIAKLYCEMYPGKIKYLDHEGHSNRGVTISRNKAVSISGGSVIAFLDSDDRWMPGKLEYQLGIMKNYPLAGMICEASVFWFSWNDSQKTDYIYLPGCPRDQLYSPGELFHYLYPLAEGNPPCPTGIMMSKKCFDRCGGFEEIFAVENQLYEDQALLNKVYLHEYVYISARPNHFYRKRDNSLTAEASIPSAYKRIRLYFLNWFSGYLDRTNAGNDQLKSQLKEAISSTEKMDQQIDQPGIAR